MWVPEETVFYNESFSRVFQLDIGHRDRTKSRGSCYELKVKTRGFWVSFLFRTDLSVAEP